MLLSANTVAFGIVNKKIITNKIFNFFIHHIEFPLQLII